MSRSHFRKDAIGTTLDMRQREREAREQRKHEDLLDAMAKHNYRRETFVGKLVNEHHYEPARAESCWRREFASRCEANAETMFEALRLLTRRSDPCDVAGAERILREVEGKQ